jgi:hypothetical protein
VKITNAVTRVVIAIGLFTIFSPMATAQSGSGIHPWLEDDFTIVLGGFYPRKEFKVSVDGESSRQGIDFDRDAAVIDSETTAMLDFRWRFGEKWSVAGQYYATRDDGQAVLQEDITWGDNVLQAGSNVGAGADLDLFRAFVGREFFTDEDYHEFGLGAGLHWLQLGAFIEGEMFINDETQGFRRESVTADLPLPNIGMWYWRSLSPRWLLTTRLDWFSASIDEYSGSLWNAGVGINYQPWDHVGFGLSWQFFRVDLDIDKSTWQGTAELQQDGPALTVNFNW